ncbi:50S ribosomal protein L18 [Akkermansiaceae bacterium]|jgi:large subunit ribosomal protein L18|nr:50S ribosomal protein L18 [Akkermansiaceae bacterium]MDB4403891.1 50S ribosomal protein L18 [Akkermansiaceae bacterium]|tara:strand:+ start:4243 stop:4599 length:357 start_codon:yes stop_codon:yes gene_type:complete
MSTLNRKKIRQKVHRRIRKKVSGTAAKPRLAVHFSNKNVYAQVIDDIAGHTLCAASTLDKEIEATGASKATAESVGKLIADRAKDAKVDAVVFDRGGHLFHGKVKVLADAAREGGLKF